MSWPVLASDAAAVQAGREPILFHRFDRQVADESQENMLNKRRPAGRTALHYAALAGSAGGARRAARGRIGRLLCVAARARAGTLARIRASL